MRSLGYARRFFANFIIFATLIILGGKLWFGHNSENVFLYVYGAVVTLILFITFFITFTRYRDPYDISKNIPDPKKEKYFVSCLVAVKNEEKIISKCLDSFINQTYKDKEIIIINDGSTDDTKKILDSYAKEGLITVIHLEKSIGKKRALAKGMLIAKGQIFACSDSDSVLANDAIERIVSVFIVDKNVGAISGHARALNGDENLLTKMQDSWYEGQFSIRKAFESVYGAITCVSGPLAVFRKEAIFNYIPAWENDRFLGSEFKFATDRTLTGYVLGSTTIDKKLKKKYADSPFVTMIDYPPRDWKLLYCKSARVLTKVPNTFKSFILQQIRWKKSFIRNLFFTGTFYWKKPIIPVVVYYSHVIFVLIGPFIVFRYLIYLPTTGNILSAILYLSGILFVGFVFGFAYKLENKDCDKWIYRPLMSLLSTLVLSWLIFYSIATIKKMVWHER